jgi:4-diphosphocytidyl-2-C-methyl-D-erythritol kinase
VSVARANAKINLALVVGATRADGKHELATVYQQVALFDRVSIESADRLSVTGFEGDTIVRAALESLAVAARVDPRWSASIEKRGPGGAGLGGGRAPAAAALRLANASLPRPLPQVELERIAAGLGADVPLFLRRGPQLGTGTGSALEPLDLPQGYWILLAVAHGAAKASTAAVYRSFDERDGARGFAERRRTLLETLATVGDARDLGRLPPNDLASSPLAGELRALGAVRADVTGAGPAVYAVFERRRDAESARRRIEPGAAAWLTAPAWYV